MPDKQLALWYKQPANNWFEALPVGNGRLGGMVFGGTGRERIALNEDTLWSGEPRDTVRYDAERHLEPVRRLIFAGRHEEAEQLIEQYMEGSEIESYLPLGDLELLFEEEGDITEYRRELDLEEGLVRVRYRRGGVLHTRELFISAPDQVLAIRLSSEGKLNVTAQLHSPLQFSARKSGSRGVGISGRAPIHVLPNTVKSPEPVQYMEGRGISFGMELQAVVDKGRVEASGGRLHISGAGTVTLLLTAATSFNGFDQDPARNMRDPEALCGEWLAQAGMLGWESLKQRHIGEYSALFKRVDLRLGSAQRDLPVDERIQAVKDGADDPALAALFFQYGRYLLISSSRPGSQPANLQGIWNDKMRPPWCSSWTANINVEMNYWPAEVTNLAECHQPLFDFTRDLSVTGCKTASVHYRSRGWTAHHNIDLWRTSTPVDGSPSWAFWPMAGAWLCQHLWEHYAYSLDEAFLRQAYPVLQGAALFCLDWLVETPDGYLATCPSTSPENYFLTEDGQKSSVTYGATMDLALIRDLFAHCIEASLILDRDETLRKQWEQALEKMLPYQVGQYGQLQEWSQDFAEHEPGHRHIAHLVALHPLNQITLHGQPDLAAACRKTLERRLEHGGAHTGWSCAWTISFWARLCEGEKAQHFVHELLAGMHPNMMNAHRHPKVKLNIFQIDGNFAGTAGIAEMLLQSHDAAIQLLPALPPQWTSGQVRGLRARGGFTIGMEWEDGQLLHAEMVSEAGQACRLRTPYPVDILQDGRILEADRSEPGITVFATAVKQRYEIVPRRP
ncbi:glycoside hydrolase family 95 protein [Paenibacillus sp. y28]|uniref:glycoside hydrolase family 95 protein n=1 Tax=Paenibacillus sp. y28 TaxID=3129110 RepID=UPI003016516C